MTTLHTNTVIFRIGNFKAGEAGTILKKYAPKEKEALSLLMRDILRPYVPEFQKEVIRSDERIFYTLV